MSLGDIYMLIRFNVGNFLSFNETQEFSMIAGKGRKKIDRLYEGQNIKLIKFASIFGANASGKTNLVKSLDFTRSLVTKGFPSNYINSYCKFKKENKNKISNFEFDVEINDRYYSYGFEIVLNTQSIKSEWLVELTKSSDNLIFSRDIEKGEYVVNTYFSDSDINTKLEIFANDIKEDDTALFLSFLNKNEDAFNSDNLEIKIFKNLFDWFKINLDVKFPNRPLNDYSCFIIDEDIKKLGSYLKAFDTGISSLPKHKTNLDQLDKDLPPGAFKKAMDLLNTKNDDESPEYGVLLRVGNSGLYLFTKIEDEVIYHVIEFNHNKKGVYYSLCEESDGTIALIDLITLLLNKQENMTYVIDGFDSCLHPKLTSKFISEFYKIAQMHKIQLIITSHESRLLNLDLLRKDEIWFTDKNLNGESSIYSLEEYNTREDKKIDNTYLEGRYRAVPVFNSSFPDEEN